MTGAARPPGLVLAGGLSRRMGADKALLPLAGTPMIERVLDRLRPQVSSVAVNAGAGFTVPAGAALVPDTIEGFAGPLAGVLAGLRHTRASHPSAAHLLTVPVDQPFIPADLARRLQEAAAGKTAVTVAASRGRMHPVAALWPVTLADDLEAWLSEPAHRRVTDFLARHAVVEVAFPAVETAIGPLDPFFNVNTPEDAARACAFLEVLP